MAVTFSPFLQGHRPTNCGDADPERASSLRFNQPVFWAYAVARLPIASSTSLLYLVPPIAVLISWAWLGQIPMPAELLGGLIVILGAVTISHGTRILKRLRGNQPQPIRGDAHPDDPGTQAA